MASKASPARLQAIDALDMVAKFNAAHVPSMPLEAEAKVMA